MQTKRMSRMNQELLDKLTIAFRPRPIDPSTPHDVIMFEAGAASVLSFIHAELKATDHTSTVSGPDAVQTVSADELFRQRISRSLR
jgi:hypothetical protein